MNTSPEAEAKVRLVFYLCHRMSIFFVTQVGDLARSQIRREMGDKILDDHHPLSRHVQRVVQRILSSNDLGSVKGMGSRLMRQDIFGGGDVWDPAAERGSSTTTSIGPGKEWDVMVVNDPQVINAMAVAGTFITCRIVVWMIKSNGVGTVIVFTGILPVCRDEQGLSAVLSHGGHFSLTRFKDSSG